MPKGIPKKGTRSCTSKYTAGGTANTASGAVRFIEIWNAAQSRERGFSNARAIVEFTDTGYIVNCQLSNLIAGKVKDMRKPSVYGVGYLDMDVRIPARDSGSEIRRLYDLWANMLKRCYTPEVGYENCTVDSRWHSFRNFINTIQDVPNYSLWCIQPMHLDKDLRIPGNRVYSRDTCSFVTPTVNMVDAANRRWGNK